MREQDRSILSRMPPAMKPGAFEGLIWHDDEVIGLQVIEAKHQAVAADTGRNKDSVHIDLITNHPHRAIAKNGVEPGRVRGTEHAVIATVVISIGRAPLRILLRLIGNTDHKGYR